MEFRKQASEFRVQIIELREANVSNFNIINGNINFLAKQTRAGPMRLVDRHIKHRPLLPETLNFQQSTFSRR